MNIPMYIVDAFTATLVGYQASARGGIVRVMVAGERVQLEGKAVIVLKGDLAAEAAFGLQPI